jgi:hypothetical protein
MISLGCTTRQRHCAGIWCSPVNAGFSWRESRGQAGLYVLALIRGFVDKTYAIPLPAILANVCWEALYGTIFRNQSPVGPYVPVAWLILDLGLLFQVLRYGRREFPGINPNLFVLIIAAGLAVCGGMLYYAQVEGIDFLSSAFPQNLMMSILFVPMIFVRTDARGQSFYVAVFKLLGTLCAILLASFPVIALSGMKTVTFLAILFFDTLYIILVYQKLRRLHFVPWRRA